MAHKGFERKLRCGIRRFDENKVVLDDTKKSHLLEISTVYSSLIEYLNIQYNQSINIWNNCDTAWYVTHMKVDVASAVKYGGSAMFHCIFFDLALQKSLRMTFSGIIWLGVTNPKVNYICDYLVFMGKINFIVNCNIFNRTSVRRISL